MQRSLAQSRFAAITGAKGVGKWVLALSCAHFAASRGQYTDGVWAEELVGKKAVARKHMLALLRKVVESGTGGFEAWGHGAAGRAGRAGAYADEGRGDRGGDRDVSDVGRLRIAAPSPSAAAAGGDAATRAALFAATRADALEEAIFARLTTRKCLVVLRAGSAALKAVTPLCRKAIAMSRGFRLLLVTRDGVKVVQPLRELGGGRVVHLAPLTVLEGARLLVLHMPRDFDLDELREAGVALEREAGGGATYADVAHALADCAALQPSLRFNAGRIVKMAAQLGRITLSQLVAQSAARRGEIVVRGRASMALEGSPVGDVDRDRSGGAALAFAEAR